MRGLGRGDRRWSPLLLALVGLLGLAACQTGPSPAAAKPGELSAAAVEGRQLFLAKGCVACHKAPGVAEAQGTMGPNLTGIGNPSAHPKIAAVLDNNPDNMKRWLQDPQKVKPGAAMPSLGLTDAETTNLAAFLETLK
jgi:cytochrome c2